MSIFSVKAYRHIVGILEVESAEVQTIRTACKKITSWALICVNGARNFSFAMLY